MVKPKDIVYSFLKVVYGEDYANRNIDEELKWIDRNGFSEILKIKEQLRKLDAKPSDVSYVTYGPRYPIISIHYGLVDDKLNEIIEGYSGRFIVIIKPNEIHLA